MTTAKNLSEYITKKCKREGNPISNLQLQKILYFIQRESLKKDLGPLFEDEFEAWPYGPVIPSIYQEYSIFVSGKISIFLTPVNETSYTPKGSKFEWIDKMIEDYRCLNPWELVEESHKKGGAWDFVYRSGIGNREIISKSLIKSRG